MAYCSAGDIVKHYRIVTFDGESRPTKSEVEVYCTDISDDLDELIRTLDVTLPLTDSGHLKIMKVTAIKGVIAEILRATGKTEGAEMHEAIYQNRRKMLLDRPDLIRETEGTIDEPRFKAAPSRSFTVGERQW